MVFKAKKKPKIGDVKKVIRFAFLPVKIENEWVWLEKYVFWYRYTTVSYEYPYIVSSGIFTEKYTMVEATRNTWVITSKHKLEKPTE